VRRESFAVRRESLAVRRASACCSSTYWGQRYLASYLKLASDARLVNGIGVRWVKSVRFNTT